MMDERGEGPVPQGSRVVLVTPGPSVRGGISQFVANLAESFSGGSQTLLIGFDRVYPRWSRAGRQASVPIGSSSGSSSDSDAGLTIPDRVLVPWFPWTWSAAARRIAEFSPDLVVLQWWNPLLGPCFRFLAKRAREGGARVAFVCHNFKPHEWFPLTGSLTRATLACGDRLFALSDSVAGELRSALPDAVVSVMGHPPNLHAEGTASATLWRERVGEGPVVLFFGNVRRYKGLSDLISAMPVVHERTGATLVVAGPFYQPVSRYRNEARRLGVADAVRFFPGYVPDEQVAGLFSVADVVALPYRSASQSGILPQAALFRRPVVATAVGGIPQALGGSGVVVPPGDVNALADGIVGAIVAPPPPPPLAADGWFVWRESLADTVPIAPTRARRRPLMTSLTYLLWIAVGYFVVAVFLSGLRGLKGTHVSLSPGPFVLAIALTAVAAVTNVMGWHVLLKGAGARLPLSTSARVFSTAELVRFLPGGVLHLAARYRFAQRVGVGPEVVVTTTALDLGLRIIVGLLVFVVSVPAWPDLPGVALWLVVPALPLLMVAFHPRVLGWAVARAGRLIKGKAVFVRIPNRAVGAAAVWSAVGWLLRGAALFSVARSLVGAAPRLLLPVAGIAGLSWVAGVMTPVAPGGLGVREAVGAALLRGFMGLGPGIVVMLVARLQSIAVEVATAGIATGWDSLAKPLTQPASSDRPALRESR